MRLIDVDRTICDIRKEMEQVHADTLAHKLYAVIVRCLETEPTVDAVPVLHGRRVQGRCTICGMCVDEWDNFCPECGVKMDLED